MVELLIHQLWYALPSSLCICLLLLICWTSLQSISGLFVPLNSTSPPTHFTRALPTLAKNLRLALLPLASKQYRVLILHTNSNWDVWRPQNPWCIRTFTVCDSSDRVQSIKYLADTGSWLWSRRICIAISLKTKFKRTMPEEFDDYS